MTDRNDPSKFRLRWARMFAATFIALHLASGVQAGPPFLTDDPEPVGLHHWEGYVFGTELFWQTDDPTSGHGVVDANFGVYLKFTEHFNLLFSLGHSLSGERNTIGYLGLYWTGGPADTGKS
jgi:hypothetical protein